MKKFWMVLAEDSDSCRFRHESKGRADYEANRLARSRPGVRFVILEAIEYRIAPEAPVEVVTDFDDIGF